MTVDLRIRYLHAWEIIGDGRQGLVQFVRQAAYHLAHGEHARHVGQLVQVLPGLFFRSALLGYVGNYRNYSGYIAIVIACVIPIDLVIDRLAGWSGKTAKIRWERLLADFVLNNFLRIWKNRV